MVKRNRSKTLFDKAGSREARTGKVNVDVLRAAKEGECRNPGENWNKYKLRR